MTFQSRTSDVNKSPVASDTLFGGTESPQLVAQSLGESYVVIAGSKPLSIIIKKCILPVSIQEFNNFSTNVEQCRDSENRQLSAEEGRCSQHCLEIACVSEEAAGPCFKTAELHLDSISRTINESGAIADGSAVCEIDCGLVNAISSQNSGIGSDGTCRQQDDNDISVNDANENSNEVNVTIEPDRSSECSVITNSLRDDYVALESDTNAETICTSESEVYVGSDEKCLVINTDLKSTATQHYSKDSEVCNNLEAILLDENAVSSLSPTYTFYGTVEGVSDVVTSRDNINDNVVLQDTCISSTDSPASPVIGSVSKVQKGARGKRCENDSRLKVKSIEHPHNPTKISDTALCSYQGNVSHCCNREGRGLLDSNLLKSDNVNVGESYQSLQQDKRNFRDIGVLSMSRQKSENVLELSCQDTNVKCDNDSSHIIETGDHNGRGIGRNRRKNHVISCHQDVIEFSPRHNNLSQSKCFTDDSLLETCFHTSTRFHEVERFNGSSICSRIATVVKSKSSMQILHGEEPLLRLTAGAIQENVSSVCFSTNVHSAVNSASVINASKEAHEVEKSVDIRDIKSLPDTEEQPLCIDGEYVPGKQEILHHRASENVSNSDGCAEDLHDESQLSSVEEQCGKLRVPVGDHEQQSSPSQKSQRSLSLLTDILCPASKAVPDQDDRGLGKNYNELSQPYNRGTEESCDHSDSIFEDFCFDSVKGFDSDYFDQFLDSPIFNTSKVTDRSRYLSVSDNSSTNPKVELVRNDTEMSAGDNIDCGGTTLEDPKFSIPRSNLHDTIGMESMCSRASQLENSPLLFSSDDENSNSQWESIHSPVKENKSPLKVATFVTVDNTVLEVLHKKLQKIQELLLGIPPPPSITMPNHNVEEMLRLIKQNEHLMVQQSFKYCESIPEAHSVKRKGSALRDVLNTSWPQIKDCDYFDIQYNHGAVSEELDRQYQRLQERFVGRETASSCNPWFTKWNATKSLVRYQRSLGQSPGSRLSHLARRRQSFSSCNLQPASISGKLPGVLHRSAIQRRVIMVDAKKEEKQQNGKLNNHRLQRSSNCIGEDDNRLKSSRRALFQSPVDDKKISSYLKSRTESHSMKTDVWRGVTKYGENRSHIVNENFNINGKRLMSDSQSHARKISRRLVFDASQPAVHSFSHHTESNRQSSITSQLTERKSNLPYVNGNHKSQAHTQPLSLSQAASKSRISGTHKKKLLWAVAEALRRKGISMNHHHFHPCASSLTKLLLSIVGNTLLVQSREDTCKITSEQLLETALQHVHTVVQKIEASRS